MRRVVVAVLIAQEHLPFIRDWCNHHLVQGWDHIHLYDNTGSRGSARRSSVFQKGVLQRSRSDKRGLPYPAATRHLDDETASALLVEAVRDLPVTIHPWKPVVNGIVMHHQAEAYADFIRRHRGRQPELWAAFIDADEYLDRAPGHEWDDLLRLAEQSDAARIQLSGIRYESRIDHSGTLRQPPLRCCGLQSQGNKNIVAIDHALTADIHWGWTTHNNRMILPDVSQFHFKHYNFPLHRIAVQTKVGLSGPASAECVFIDPLPPLLGSAEIQCIAKHLRPDSTVVEFGGGGSTGVLSPQVARFIVIEHDDHWAAYVRQFAPRAELIHVPNDTEPVLDGPYPPDYRERWGNYWGARMDCVPDVAIIDGRCRLECARRCVRDGVQLIFMAGWRHLRYRAILFEPVELIEILDTAEGMAVLRNISPAAIRKE